MKEFEEDGGFLARRSTGGAVYHDRKPEFLLYLPQEEYDLAKNLKVILGAVRSFGIGADFRRNDIMAEGKSFQATPFGIPAGQSPRHHLTPT